MTLQPDDATLPPRHLPTDDTATIGHESPVAESATPVAITGYEILGILGRGGMGVVYKARQTGLNRLVALKMVLSGVHAGESDLARFRTEAEAIARVQHPNIVAVHEIGEHDGRPFMALEFCGRGSLESQLDGTPRPPRVAAEWVRTLATAMQAAHDRNVIHRDLKPANILIADDGTLKVTDFGLARKMDDDSGATRTGTIMGSPSYMAPEQAEGSRDVGPLADVYALGAIRYELLTGGPPFRGASILETLEQVRTQEPVPVRQLQPKTLRQCR